jgi:hypothetical protein
VREAGESFMPYRAAELRLRNLVVVAAGDAPALVKRVFEDAPGPRNRALLQTGEGYQMSAYRQ